MLEKIGKVYTDKSREKAINSLISSNYNVAILDDGFQDYSIKKISQFCVLIQDN